MNVSFTVDAYPGRVYHGRVVPQGKLPFRLNATMNQNVVTYTVVVSVDDEENKDGALRPYMTCNLTFLVGEKDNVLMVPNAALRWQPARAQIAPEIRDAYARLRNQKRAPHDPDSINRGIVWVKGDDGFVRYLEVRTGLSDSVHSEIVEVLSGELPEGTQVIVGETHARETHPATRAIHSSPSRLRRRKRNSFFLCRRPVRRFLRRQWRTFAAQ